MCRMTITEHGIRQDVGVEVCGTLYLLSGLTSVAREWLVDNVHEDAIWWGDSLVVEGNYFPPLFDAMSDAGLIVR